MTATDTLNHEVPPLKHPVKRHATGRSLVRISSNVADVLEDPKLVEDWDEEELRRGRRRDKNGKFTGRDPIVIPTAAYREIVRRAIRKGEAEMATNLEAACRTLTSIATSLEAEDRDRIKAAELILNRIMGREPQKHEHAIKTPLFLGIIQGGIVSGGEPVVFGAEEDDDIEDAEVISDSDEVIWE